MATIRFNPDFETAAHQKASSRLTRTVAVYPEAPAAAARTLWQIFETTAGAFPEATAIDDGQCALNYLDLLRETRRAGRRLAALGIGGGDRVGIRITSGTAELYLSILAVLSVGAAYVPVDVDDPADRAELVWSAAGVRAILGDGGELTWRTARSAEAATRQPVPADDAWIIFTSGTSGIPKGVAVTHRSAAAFVDAEARLFVRDDPLGPGDRVLAGLSVAFDASCEEMWLAWGHGACLVPAPRPVVKAGPDLVSWLEQHRVSVVSTVPTLAALWPAGPPHGVRLLILGGEACPPRLADRLAREGTEVWNTYGPTEATVVACAARLSGGEPVRIGLPLDGWRLAVADPVSGQPVPWGEAGELVIGGAGVARYLDTERDAVAFRPLEALGPERAYHTGDVVRADPEGLVYLGRADAQVKIRGYRIELNEVEAVLAELPGIGLAAVTTCEPLPGVVELAGYYTLQNHAGLDHTGLDHTGLDHTGQDQTGAPDSEAVSKYLRNRLPRHMVPAYLQELPAMPLLPGGKVDRRNLPEPTSSARLRAGHGYVAPATPGEKALADALAGLLGAKQVSVESEFFDELGMSSLMAAHFCTAARQRSQASSLSVKDVYQHPTIRRLSAAVAGRPPAPGTQVSPAGTGRVPPASTAQYVACGAVQALAFLASVLAGAAVLSYGFGWVSGGSGLTSLYLRSLGFSAGLFFLLCGLPIAAKWALIGRWKPREIRIWSLPYLRFWLVKTLIRADPLALFAGSPLYSLYLRALGARIGRRVVIFSTTVPVCTDLLAIGDDTVIRKESSFTGYRAVDGVIQTGPVSIGRESLIGEHTVLDIGTSVGSGSQLGHTSSLQESQAVPDGQRWHGSPAQRTDVDYRRAAPVPSGRLRRTVHGTVQLLSLILVTLPLGTAVSVAGLTRTPAAAWLTALGSRGFGMIDFYEDGLLASTVLFCGAILAGAVIVVTVPRLLRRLVRPGRAYPLYGMAHSAHRAIHSLTNIKFYLELLGDSSYVVPYLRALGYRLPGLEQTGSNFGADVEHDTPFLVDIGRGTMIADGATLIDADYTSTSFQVTPLSIGPRNFIGNAVAYPAGGRTGENCIIATKAMVPLDGPVRANTGLLGSPCFQIPRSATSDDRFDHLRTGEEFRTRLAAKNRHNLATMGLFLAVRWVHAFVLTLLAMAAWDLYQGNTVLVLAGLTVTALLFSLGYFITVERALLRFRSLRPRYCSIYDPYFWWHERYWKLMAPLAGLFDGTPFKGPLWRLLGVRAGRRIFDDGCSIAERTLVTIGDHCTLNAGSVIQCHSMEDGIFKSDRTVLEDGCTLGAGALVHYGVTVGQGSQLRPDSFLMKGESVPPHARWGGNPARAM
jgi:non-ribosomal peptide synthetase-like protein